MTKKAILGVAVLLLSRLALSTQTPHAQELVVWTELRGASAAESTLEKASPAGRGAGAVSTRSLHSGDGHVEFGVAGASGGVACGLTRHGHDVAHEEIDFALLLGAEGRLSIVESGQVRGTGRAYAASDRFRVAVEKGVVVYRQNGELLFTSQTPVRYPLRVQASLTGAGAGLRDVSLAGNLVENVEWVGGAGTGTYANDVLKVRDAEEGAAGALSAQALSGDGLLEWRVDDPALGAAVGLVSLDSASPEGDPGAFDHALRVRGGTLFVLEGGAPPEAVENVKAGDRLGVAVQGDAVEYRVNGRLVQASALSVSRPLRISAEMEDLGAAVDAVVVSGRTTRVVGRRAVISVPTGHYEEPVSVAVLPVEPGAAVTYATHGGPPTESDMTLAPRETVLVAADTELRARAWPKGEIAGAVSRASYTLGPVASEDVVWRQGKDGQAVSTREITSLDGFVETVVGEAATQATIGLSSSGRSGAPDFALVLEGSRLVVSERGRRRGVFGAVQSGDRLRVAVEGGLLKYRQNGRLLGTSHIEPSLPLAARAAGTLMPAVLSGRLEDSTTPESAPRERMVETLLLDLPAPVLWPSPGTYIASVTVSITGEVGATIHYTTDGVTEPTEASPTYTAPLVLAATTTIKAKAFYPPDWSPSPTVTGTYTLKAATPVIAPNGGTYSGVKSVAVTTTTPAATVRYSLDGAEPTETDAAVGSTGTVLLAATATFKAKAFKTGLTASETASADFVFERPGAAAGGESHSLVLKPDGTVWAWGQNNNGQLGDGSLTQRKVPVQSAGVSGAVAIAAAGSHSLALGTNGHVLAWGLNSSGELGDGTTTRRPNAVEVTSAPGVPISDVVAIAAGTSHSLALKADGSVWAWGANSYGQLGEGSTTNRTRATAVAQLQGVTAIGAGASHSLAVRGTDGSGWSWGRGTNGQLGDGTTTTRRLLPVAIDGVTGASAVRGGSAHSLALGIEGLAWAWGANNYGQMGDGTNLARLTPVRVEGLASAVDLVSGWNHGLARTNGEAWAWGGNGEGELGDGTTTMRIRPVRVPALAGLVAVGAGASHSLAIDADGAVWAWGYNYYSQLGDGTTGDGTNSYRTSPVSVSGPDFAWRVGAPVMSVAPGTRSAPFTVALTSVTAGATIYYSTNGDDPSTPYIAPVSISATTLLKARAIKAGQPDSNLSSALYTLKPTQPTFSPAGGTYAADPMVTMSCSPTSCAAQGLTIRYTVDGSEPTSSSFEYSSPVLISHTTTLKAKAFRAGWSDSDTRSANYTLSRGTLAAPTLTPAGGTYLGSQAVAMSSIAGATVRYTLDGATDPTAQSPEYTSPITLSATTTVKAKAFHPEWTTSSTATATYTIQVAEPPTISLASGEYPVGEPVVLTSSDPGASVLYTLDGSAPTTASQGVPSGTTLRLTRALTLNAAAFRPGCSLSDVATASYTVTGTVPTVTVTGGDRHSLLAKADGTVWAWGGNNNGQIGDSTYSSRLMPVLLASPSGIVSVDAGESQSVGWVAAASVWAWGANSYGKLGDGTTTGRPTPVQIASPTSVVAVSTGESHTLAVESDGTAWAWGRNNVGQLGIGSTTPSQSASPVQITSLSDVAAVSSGTAHGLAVKGDETVWAWGSNSYGQLGDGSTTQRNAPVQVSGLSGVVSVAAGEVHSLALKSDGTVWAWGYGSMGQIGDGLWSLRTTTPVQVPGLSGAVAVTVAYHRSFAVLSDGTLWAWGSNGSDGALGDGTTTSRGRPVLIPIPGAVIAVGAGTSHSLAVTLDGGVWAWGDNSFGQLGLGTTASPMLTPKRVSDVDCEWRVGVPVFTPGAGTYDTETTVQLSSATPGATICYSTDGTDPSGCQQSLPSGGSILVARSLTVRAIGTKAGMPPSEETQAAYALALDAPTLLPAPTTYYSDVTVSMTGPAGASIRYTTDGSDPTETTGTPYAAPVPVTRSQTVYARAFRAGWTTSPRAGGSYTMKVASPTFNPPAGSYAAAQTITLATTTPGAQLHFTTDGREPTVNDPAGGTLVVDRSMTVKAKAFRDGWTTSDTAAAAYFLTLGSAAAPTMDPPGGSYSAPQHVALHSETPGARIRYTIDGSEPTPFSRPYLAPVLIDETATLKAKAFGGDTAPSPTAIEAYTIAAAPVAAPRFVPASGVFATARSVAVSCDTAGAVIHYTMDGADPTQGDPTIASGQSLNVDRSTTLKARAWLDGTPSAVREGNYHITGAIAAGGVFTAPAHSLALRADGHVWSWGMNDRGQLGEGTTTNRAAPIEAQASAGAPLADVVAVEAGWHHSLAVKTDGHVWAWGDNSHGQLGSGSTTSVPVMFPVEVKLESGQALDGVVALAAGQHHSLALTSGGTVWAWGWGQSGVLGDGTNGTTKAYAVSVTRASDGQPLDGVVTVATSHAHCIALRSDGTVWGWGYGKGVDGSTSYLTRAVQVTGLSGFVDVAAGVHFSVAVRIDGTVWAWGDNSSGQLGHGSTVDSARPERAAGLTRATQVDVGPYANHVAALVPGAAGEQTVWAWGAATRGQMGDGPEGATTDRLTPAQVPRLVDVIAASAGGTHTMALLGDGTVWTWGEDYGGVVLGRDTTSHLPASTPGPVPGFTIADTSWVMADPDADGLPTGIEWRLGTDALKADTNGDGVPDGAAVKTGMTTTDPDTDGDGVRNVAEVAQGTDPQRVDTDGDGVGDGQDCHPLDPSRSQCAPPVPGDTTPPSILLAEPASALLISSLP